MFPDIDRLLLQRNATGEEKNEINTALQKARLAVSQARSSSPQDLALALSDLAGLLSQVGLNREARAAVDQALDLGLPVESSADALITSGICAIEDEDLDSAEFALYRAVDACRKSGYKAGLARALHNLAATVLVIRGKFDLALFTMEEAHALRTELGMKDWGWPWLRAYLNLIYGNRRRARQALDELIREIEPATRTAGGYYFLWSRLSLDENEFDKAHEYLRLGLRIATQTGVPDLNLWIRIEHARYYRKTARLAEGREWAEDAAQLARRSGYHYFEGLALCELALIEWDAGETVLANSHLDQAETIFSSFGASYDLANIAYTRALWDRLSENPQAVMHWKRAAAAIERGGFSFLLETQQESAFPLIATHLRSPDPGARIASERLLQQLSRVQPPALRIAGLGQFAVWKGRQLIAERSWQKRKVGELFRYLLLQPHRSAGKEAILEALWPERDLDSGKDLLHQATSALRRVLEPDLPDKFPSRYLSYEGEKITLLLPQGSSVDYELFRQEMPAALQSNDVDRLQDALNLYTGELFPADRYMEWTIEMRESLTTLFATGLLELATLQFNQMQYADALDGCRTLIRLDPLHEEAAHLAMRCHIELGASTHALRIYLALEKNLKQELGIEPPTVLRQLAESLRSR